MPSSKPGEASARIAVQNSFSSEHTGDLSHITNVPTLVIWRFSDGRAGHDAQSRGLIDALNNRIDCDNHEIHTSISPLCNLAFYPFRHFPPGRLLPAPDLLIGAGHGTHAAMLCAQRAYGGLTVVLMRPSLPTSWFDYCLIPEHDSPAPDNNIITTSGVLNMLSPTREHDSGVGLIMIGGKSRHYVWDNNKLMQQINKVITQSGLLWTLTDSPRTPEITRRSLQLITGKNVRYLPYKSTPPGWLPETLQQAGIVWVTQDSISMIYEALTAGCAVGVFDLSTKKPDRITRAIQTLCHNKKITAYSSWAAGALLRPLDPPLHEASRCAEILLQKITQ